MRKATITAKAPLPGDQSLPDHAAVGGQRELWKVLDALALCRRDYGLAANSLSVLRALISFLPKSTPADGALVVWPSNKALCERADGMDERTLRRHIDRLVKAGLIERRSSSNGKRFALRCRSTIVTAFGFDLRQLRDNANAVATCARLLRDEAEQSAALRVEILNLLHARNETSTPLLHDEDSAIRKMLRRRSDPQMLLATRDNLRKLVSIHEPPAAQMTARNSQIDRHQQRTEEDSCKSVCAQNAKEADTAGEQGAQRTCHDQSEADISLEDCLSATTESRAFAPQPVRTWTDFMRLADMLAPMIGVEKELANHAKRAMGPLQAAISILCVIQRSNHIRRPAAYLRRLATLAEVGQYSLKSLVRSASQVRFAAANHAHAWDDSAQTV